MLSCRAITVAFTVDHVMLTQHAVVFCFHVILDCPACRSLPFKPLPVMCSPALPVMCSPALPALPCLSCPALPCPVCHAGSYVVKQVLNAFVHCVSSSLSLTSCTLHQPANPCNARWHNVAAAGYALRASIVSRPCF